MIQLSSTLNGLTKLIKDNMTEKTLPDAKILGIMTEILTSVGETISKGANDLPNGLFTNLNAPTPRPATPTPKTETKEEPLPDYVEDGSDLEYVSAFESLDRAFQLLKELEDWATDQGDVEFLLKIADRYVQLGSVLM